MRLQILLILALATLSTEAQLVNGSFEQNGLPSLMGWEWTCGQPGQPPGDAPGAGDWAATKEPGHTQGCFPSYLFQRLTNVQDGDLVSISGWFRCDTVPQCLGAFGCLGRLNAGAIELEENTGTMDPTWSFLSFSDTVELGPLDTAILVLGSGLIGGPISPTPAWFDGLSISSPQGITPTASATVAHYPDPATEDLYIAFPDGTIDAVRTLDLTGHLLDVPTISLASGAVHLDVSRLASGLYIAQVFSGSTTCAVRFVVH